MSVLETPDYITPKEYLEGEALRQVKHQYRNGRIYEMNGSTRRHNTIAGNAAMLLQEHLDKTSCLVYIVDIKVRVEAVNCYYYPDVIVTCDERDNLDDTAADDDTVDDTVVRFPRLIIEVLSDSTEADDRGAKFADYRTLETLEEYVLIRQDEISVERFTKGPDGTWSIHPPLCAGVQVHLSSIDLTFPIEALYTKVNLLRR